MSWGVFPLPCAHTASVIVHLLLVLSTQRVALVLNPQDLMGGPSQKCSSVQHLVSQGLQLHMVLCILESSLRQGCMCIARCPKMATG